MVSVVNFFFLGYVSLGSWENMLTANDLFTIDWDHFGYRRFCGAYTSEYDKLT